MALDFQKMYEAAIVDAARKDATKTAPKSHRVDDDQKRDPSIDAYLARPFSFKSSPTKLGQQFLVGSVPTVYYVTDWITVKEETLILKEIYEAPKECWVQLKRRRLQQWGGQPKPLSEGGMAPETLPQWCKTVAERVIKTQLYSEFGLKKEPNHVLLNEYLPGQGIMPHKDGPLYAPFVCILSLNSALRINFFNSLESSRSPEGCVLSLYLKPRSLLVFADDMYESHWHGIDDTTEDLITEKVANFCCAGVLVGDVIERREKRVSLTIRSVQFASS